MFVLGLTGSLGMGKSTTARFFAEAGVPVHDADAVVHRLYEGEAVKAIEAAFPGTTADGKVDRNLLAARVLDDPAALKRLESIVHPLVQAAERRLLAETEARGETIAVLDIPLLFETGGDKRLAGLDLLPFGDSDGHHQTRHWTTHRLARIGGLLQRHQPRRRGLPLGVDVSPGRHSAMEKLEAILAQQMPDAEKRRRADFVVDTSQGFDAARAQVRAILDAAAKMPRRRR